MSSSNEDILVCRGSIALGTGCGKCSKCAKEQMKIAMDNCIKNQEPVLTPEQENTQLKTKLQEREARIARLEDEFGFPTLILQVEAVCLVAWVIFYAFAKWLGLL